MNKKEWIAVAVAVVFVGYVFFSDSLLTIFNLNMSNHANSENSVQGFKVQDVVVGNGATAEASDTITTNYVGKLPNGQVFDSSQAHGPITFVLGVGQVIRGWDQGLIGMKEGGRRILTISPEFAYGDRQVGPIPPNSTLIFEVELLKVAKSK